MTIIGLSDKIDELNHQTPDGSALTIQEIADFCGCSRSTIRSIERSGMTKLSKMSELRKYLDVTPNQTLTPKIRT